jgi:hypothetical protein
MSPGYFITKRPSFQQADEPEKHDRPYRCRHEGADEPERDYSEEAKKKASDKCSTLK